MMKRFTMGHFGRRPIQYSWLAIVFPCLLLNYFGQGAGLLRDPTIAPNPFYSLVPSSLIYPMSRTSLRLTCSRKVLILRLLSRMRTSISMTAALAPPCRRPHRAQMPDETLAKRLAWVDPTMKRVVDLYKKEGGTFPEPILNLDWYPEYDADRVAKDINGHFTRDTKVGDKEYKKGDQVPSFVALTDDGATTSMMSKLLKYCKCEGVTASGGQRALPFGIPTLWPRPPRRKGRDAFPVRYTPRVSGPQMILCSCSPSRARSLSATIQAANSAGSRLPVTGEKSTVRHSRTRAVTSRANR